MSLFYILVCLQEQSTRRKNFKYLQEKEHTFLLTNAILTYDVVHINGLSIEDRLCYESQQKLGFTVSHSCCSKT